MLSRGDRVEIYWTHDDDYYSGVVQQLEHGSNRALIAYDDGEREVLDLSAEIWRHEKEKGKYAHVVKSAFVNSVEKVHHEEGEEEEDWKPDPQEYELTDEIVQTTVDRSDRYVATVTLELVQQVKTASSGQPKWSDLISPTSVMNIHPTHHPVDNLLQLHGPSSNRSKICSPSLKMKQKTSVQLSISTSADRSKTPASIRNLAQAGPRTVVSTRFSHQTILESQSNESSSNSLESGSRRLKGQYSLKRNRSTCEELENSSNESCTKKRKIASSTRDSTRPEPIRIKPLSKNRDKLLSFCTPFLELTRTRRKTADGSITKIPISVKLATTWLKDESRRPSSPVRADLIDAWAHVCSDLCLQYVHAGLRETRFVPVSDELCTWWKSPQSDLRLFESWGRTRPLTAEEVQTERSIATLVAQKLSQQFGI